MCRRNSVAFLKYQSGISPLTKDNFSQKLVTFLNTCQEETIPVLSDYEVYYRIKKAKKPGSFVKGEVHPKLMKAFQVEFTAPATILYN